VFTGLIETTATLSAKSRRGPDQRLTIATTLAGLELGESIAVSGACLTVAALAKNGFEADISLETAEKTTLGRLEAGAKVNLERSLALGDRLGGHLVSGHVDGIARVTELQPTGDALRVMIGAPRELMRFVASKGSVALDGVSLTVNAVDERGFDVMLIPHTLAATNLGDLQAGRELNLEVDLLARYVVRYLESAGATAAQSAPERDMNLRAALERAGMLDDRR
jgi:riboflavin synthase